MEWLNSDSRDFPFDHFLHALGNALDLRDDETAGHSRRVVRYSHEIGRVIGCSEEQLGQLARAAYIHDIGKIAIPDAILRKPGRLTAEESDVMKTHPWIGYSIVSEVPDLAPVAEIILAHHERWDGLGYPRRLRAEKIPLGARVFTVADTLDAMTTDRPYRKAFPFSAAHDEIAGESGKQFDPMIVQAFLSIPEDGMRGIILTEKRRSLRVPLDIQVRCRGNGGARILQAVNISEGGMLLGNAQGVEIRTLLHLDFCLPPGRNLMATEGRVARKELPGRIAVGFNNISPDALEAIREYVGQRVEA